MTDVKHSYEDEQVISQITYANLQFRILEVNYFEEQFLYQTTPPASVRKEPLYLCTAALLL